MQLASDRLRAVESCYGAAMLSPQKLDDDSIHPTFIPKDYAKHGAVDCKSKPSHNSSDTICNCTSDDFTSTTRNGLQDKSIVDKCKEVSKVMNYSRRCNTKSISSYTAADSIQMACNVTGYIPSDDELCDPVVSDVSDSDTCVKDNVRRRNHGFRKTTKSTRIKGRNSRKRLCSANKNVGSKLKNVGKVFSREKFQSCPCHRNSSSSHSDSSNSDSNSNCIDNSNNPLEQDEHTIIDGDIIRDLLLTFMVCKQL